MEKIVPKTAGFKHRDNSWEIVKVSVRVNDQERQIKWPPRVKYKEQYYNLKEDTIDRRPMYVQEVSNRELISIESTPSTNEQQLQLLERFCEKQNTQIIALVHRVRELERELINLRKGKYES